MVGYSRISLVYVCVGQQKMERSWNLTLLIVMYIRSNFGGTEPYHYCASFENKHSTRYSHGTQNSRLELLVFIYPLRGFSPNPEIRTLPEATPGT